MFSYIFSLKDDDSGDHDQDQGSPKDSEKEKNEDDDKEQNVSKKKASSVFFVAYRKKKNSIYISMSVLQTVHPMPKSCP